MKKKICLWSCPRNVSTALMYSFRSRPDTMVFDEPLYAHYLKVSNSIQELLSSIQSNLFNQAKDFQKQNTFTANSYDEFKSLIQKNIPTFTIDSEKTQDYDDAFSVIEFSEIVYFSSTDVWAVPKAEATEDPVSNCRRKTEPSHLYWLTRLFL